MNTLNQLFCSKIFYKRTGKSEHIQKGFRDHNSMNFITLLNLVDF